MGFGGAAAAANAAIKRNAALRSKRHFLSKRIATWGPLPGRKQTASAAVRKRFYDRYRAERERERRRDISLTVGTAAVTVGATLYFFL